MAHLDYTYCGTAYPLHIGGRVEWDKPTTVNGAFHVEDFQDGAGVTLDNGERPTQLWMVPKRILREYGWPILKRKRQKEEGKPCPECGRYLQLWSSGKCPDCTQGVREPPLKQVSPDRAVITDDDREMCRACGELPATRGMYCRRCDDSIRDEREMRDA